MGVGVVLLCAHTAGLHVINVGYVYLVSANHSDEVMNEVIIVTGVGV